MRLCVGAAFAYALLLLSGAACTQRHAAEPAAVRLPVIDPATDYGKGVSALAAGEIDGTLIIAGGANFPDTPAAEGGQKRFYDDIWILPAGADEWLPAGKMPAPAAYAAVYALADRIIVAGGADSGGSRDGVFEISLTRSACDGERCDGLDGEFVIVTPLPSLPAPIEQAAAAHDGATLYLAGGLSDGTPSTAVYRCVLASGDMLWERIAELPEPVVQPVAAVCGGRLYVWGGFDPVEKRSSAGGLLLDLATGSWSRIGGLPDGGTLTGAAAVQETGGRLWVVGGVDREIFDMAINLPPERTAEYLSQPVGYYRFRPQIMVFDPATGVWSEFARTEHAARAGAAAVITPRGVAIINGELKPGIRSAESVIIETTNLRTR